MVNKAILDYIQKYHSQGYSLQTLKNFLVKQGYPINEVNEAVNLVYKPEHHSISKIYLFLIVGIVLVISISLILLIISALTTEEVANISLRVYGDESSINKGESLLYKVYVENFGTKSSFPINIRYELMKENFLEKQGTYVINSLVGEKIYDIRPDKVGSYSLKITGNYEGKSTYGIFNFQVKPVCGDGICDPGENSQNCPNDCVLDEEIDDEESDNDEDDGKEIVVIGYCGDGICNLGENSQNCPIDCGVEVPKIIGSYCGDDICDPGEDFLNCPSDCNEPLCGNLICEVTENYYNCPVDCPRSTQNLNTMTEYRLEIYIKEGLETKTPENIARDCSGIEVSKNKDSCFNYLSRHSKSFFYCSKIINPHLKDDCFIHYAFNLNDYEVCEEVNDVRKKENCKVLEMQYNLLKALEG